MTALPTTASPTTPANARRIWLLVWPREHGAWGILLVPLFTGAAAGLRSGHDVVSLALFTLAALALFCLRTPVETLMESTPWRINTPQERGIVYIWLAAYTALATVALGLLFIWKGAYLLLGLGAAVLGIFLLQAGVRKLGRSNRAASQLIGSLGLTSTAAAAYYVVAHRMGLDAFLFWGLNWLFAANQILFVQLRIEAAKAQTSSEKIRLGRSHLNGEVLTILLLLAAWFGGILPPRLALPFVPIFYRGTVWFIRKPEPLRIHRLGVSELTHAIIFGALLVLACYLPSL